MNSIYTHCEFNHLMNEFTLNSRWNHQEFKVYSFWIYDMQANLMMKTRHLTDLTNLNGEWFIGERLVELFLAFLEFEHLFTAILNACILTRFKTAPQSWQHGLISTCSRLSFHYNWIPENWVQAFLSHQFWWHSVNNAQEMYSCLLFV